MKNIKHKLLGFVLMLFAFSTLAQNLSGLEYFIDTDPGVGLATKVNLTSAASTVEHNFNVDISGIVPGFHRLYVRTCNTEGLWSLSEGRPFYVIAPAELLPASSLVAAEYFFDTDPGVGKGTPLSFISGTEIEPLFEISTTGLEPGFHRLGIRVKNTDGNWSLAEQRAFYVLENISLEQAAPIMSVEYTLASEKRTGQPSTIVAGLDIDSLTYPISIDLSGHEIGNDTLYVTVTDKNGVTSFCQYATFSILDNQMPVVANQSFTIEENSINGTLVGTLLATDTDGDALTYSLVSGNTHNAFTIGASSGKIMVANDTILDYETVPIFDLEVEISDGNFTVAAHATITLIDLDEHVNQPPIITAQAFTVDENSAAGTLVGTVIASDPDGDVVQYTIVSGNINDAFTIDSTSGALFVNNSEAMDYETTTQFDLIVNASDQSLKTEATVTVALIDIEESGTGIESISNGCKIYPNPASTAFHIKGITQQATICLYSMDGSLIRQFKGTNQETKYKVSDLQQGIYILTIKSKEKTHKQKLTIQR